MIIALFIIFSPTLIFAAAEGFNEPEAAGEILFQLMTDNR
jgi:hypothetical protein